MVSDRSYVARNSDGGQGGATVESVTTDGGKVFRQRDLSDTRTTVKSSSADGGKAFRQRDLSDTCTIAKSPITYSLHLIADDIGGYLVAEIFFNA